ncbi:hypothetical protein Q7P37_011105 [Cladosporium fusiforme]
MRLLRAGTFEPGQEKLEIIEEFGLDVPEYAILSHTWGRDEVTYQHVLGGTAQEHGGYNKVLSAMRLAASDGLEYIWIDTCCIDKSSSAELSEALNSMYAWYERSKKCYAILEDVPERYSADFVSKFSSSRWFTRGWTLQELLAPTNVYFFGKDCTDVWTPIGDRIQLQDQISEVTKIPFGYLDGREHVHHASVAKRMSWAAKRQTKREEDVAYSLLGLFQVNMPMLYGEGSKAFLRLQEEIMKQSDDHSIFAWTKQPLDDYHDSSENGSTFEWVNEYSDDNIEFDELRNAQFMKGTHGLLADSPADYAQSGKIVAWTHAEDQTPYQMTNRGLSISLRLQPLTDCLCIGLLECHVEYETTQRLGILMERLHNGPKQFARVQCRTLTNGIMIGSRPPSPLFVRQAIFEQEGSAHVLLLRRFRCELYQYNVSKTFRLPPPDTNHASKSSEPQKVPSGYPEARSWIPSPHPTVFLVPQAPQTAALALELIRQADEKRLFVLIGTTRNSQVGFSVAESYDEMQLKQNNFGAHARGVSQRPGKAYFRVNATIETYVEAGHKTYALDLVVMDLSNDRDVSKSAKKAQRQNSLQLHERHRHEKIPWLFPGH